MGVEEAQMAVHTRFDQPSVRYAVDVLQNQNIQDQNVVIVCGGLTGCELAYDLAKKNRQQSLY